MLCEISSIELMKSLGCGFSERYRRLCRTGKHRILATLVPRAIYFPYVVLYPQKSRTQLLIRSRGFHSTYIHSSISFLVARSVFVPAGTILEVSHAVTIPHCNVTNSLLFEFSIVSLQPI